MAPSSTSSSNQRRDTELNNAFDGGDDNSTLPGYNELSAGSVAVNMNASDVFFDAGDALPDEPAQTPVNDPLGANSASSSSSPHFYLHPAPLFGSGRTPGGTGYDFERPSYFPTTTRRPTGALDGHAPRVASGMSAPDSEQDGDRTNDHDHDDEGGDLHLGSADQGRNRSTNGQYGLIGGGHDLTRLDRARFALGRFGRLVGMGIPGARYASVSSNGRAGQPRRPRVMGGGIGQDGVFANLNAKPERPRRNAASGAEDRGEDDDLAEEQLPPTYQVAAADAAPPYWETTILGTASGPHPLAGGLGWTPGGAHVGAIEDLIIDGLPVGNFFGFAWNMLVSMTFQFVGFLLTYLLHTTHAARCGSRSGLGITLIQYGFYLRTRATEIAEGKFPGDAGEPMAGVWFGEDPTEQGAGRKRSMVARALLGRDDLPPPPPTGTGTTLADMFAAQGESTQDRQSMSVSTEWFSYILMVLGWFILLSSLLSYWRMHRWGQSLVDAHRRDEQQTETTTTEETSAPVGFINRFRNAFSRSGGGARQHSAEDWVIFPGMGQRLGRQSTSAHDLEDDEGLDTSDAQLNPSERRLLHEMRNVGLLG